MVAFLASLYLVLAVPIAAVGLGAAFVVAAKVLRSNATEGTEARHLARFLTVLGLAVVLIGGILSFADPGAEFGGTGGDADTVPAPPAP